MSVIGSSSAVGVAERKQLRIGREKWVWACAIKDLRSVLEMPPIFEQWVQWVEGRVIVLGELTGLRSALEQSYLVYPRFNNMGHGRLGGSASKGLPGSP